MYPAAGNAQAMESWTDSAAHQAADAIMAAGLEPTEENALKWLATHEGDFAAQQFGPEGVDDYLESFVAKFDELIRLKQELARAAESAAAGGGEE